MIVYLLLKGYCLDPTRGLSVERYLGIVKPRDNTGQRSPDSAGLGQLCKFKWGALQFSEPVTT